MTDSNDVKLTVREAVNNDDVRRKSAILPWRVIGRLNVPGGDAIGIEGLDETCALAYPDQRTRFIHIDGYTRRAAGVGIGETAGFQVTPGHTRSGYPRAIRLMGTVSPPVFTKSTSALPNYLMGRISITNSEQGLTNNG
jgi:hypothetical protein